MSKKFKIKDRIRSFGPALKGLQTLFVKEHNSWIHLVAAGVAIGGGIYLDLELWEWIAVIFCIALVFSLELMNSALERAVDLARKEQNQKAQEAKDLAAAAVLVCATAAAIVGVLIFGPKILALL